MNEFDKGGTVIFDKHALVRLKTAGLCALVGEHHPDQQAPCDQLP